MAVRVISDAIELQVDVTETSLSRLTTKIFTLGKLNSICRSLHTVVTNFSRIAYRFEKMRRYGWLATGKLNRHLTTRLDRNGVIQDFFNVVHAEFMDKANLIRI